MNSLARLPHIRLGAVVALAVAGGLVAAVLLGRSEHGPAKAVAEKAKPAVAPKTVSARELRRIAAAHSMPVYWAGQRRSRVLELTKTAQGRVYVRYLTRQARIGDPRPAFLTVGTYPHASAFGAVQAAAKRPGAVGFTAPHGGVAVYDRATPTNLYLAYPGAREQIEVYSPSAAEARRLVQSGRIRPVSEATAAVSRAPVALSPAQLRKLAAAAGPIYWAGPRSGKVYEVTRTGEGRIYVRYLQSATQLGSPRPDSLTVATYPQRNAFAEIKAASRRTGAVSIPLAGGGLAVYDGTRPTSIYLAYPGSKQQIEVFAPSPNAARRLVEAGRIQPVS